MNIILATDGSDHALTAARLLARLPLPPHTLVTVLSAVPLYNGLETPLLADIEEGERALAQRAVDHAAVPLCRRDVKVVFEIYQGDPATAILERAKAGAADLIVVASHGKGAVERYLIGSVSERVARHAACSVLVVRSERLRKVVVGIDSSMASEHALDALAEFPLPAPVELKLLHVVRPEPPFSIPRVPGVDGESVIEALDHARMAAAHQTMRFARARVRADGRSAAAEICCGSPAEALIEFARATNADLLVVGAANRSPLERLFLGSVSTRVLRQAPCSVLIARATKGIVQAHEFSEEARSDVSPGVRACQPVLG